MISTVLSKTFPVLSFIFTILMAVQSFGDTLNIRESFHVASTNGGSQRHPVAAFAQGIYLVVWQEGRYGWGPPADTAIRGVRIRADGKLIDKESFVISNAPDFQEKPVVATDGKEFFVGWQDMRNGKDYDIYAARVTIDGKVLDPDGIPVAKGEGNQCSPAVAFDGENFIVVWMDNRKVAQSYEIRAARVSLNGIVLDPNGVIVKGFDDLNLSKRIQSDNLVGLPVNSFPQIGCNNGECLLGWISKEPPYSWDQFIRFKYISSKGGISTNGKVMSTPKDPIYEQGNVRNPGLSITASNYKYLATFSGLYGKGDGSYFIAGLFFDKMNSNNNVIVTQIRANRPGGKQGETISPDANGNFFVVWVETDSDFTIRPPRPITYKMMGAIIDNHNKVIPLTIKDYDSRYIGNPLYINGEKGGLLIHEEINDDGLIKIAVTTHKIS